jgi:membrane protein implicated in regulation of membrane protease activity
MGAFRDIEFAVPLSVIAILVALCLPVLQMSPALFIVLSAAAVLLVLVPWFYLKRRGRRRLKELLDKDDQSGGDR